MAKQLQGRDTCCGIGLRFDVDLCRTTCREFAYNIPLYCAFHNKSTTNRRKWSSGLSHQQQQQHTVDSTHVVHVVGPTEKT